jgi:hypothetical protein
MLTRPKAVAGFLCTWAFFGFPGAFAQQVPLKLQLVTLTNPATANWQFKVLATGPAGSNALLQFSPDNRNWEMQTFVTCNGQVEQEAGIAGTIPTGFFRLLMDDTFTTNRMLRGIIRYSGPRPGLTNVSYTALDGKIYTVIGAYAGWCVLYADATTSFSTISNAVQAQGGAVLSAMPAAGIYQVRVSNGDVAAFLSSLYAETWFVDGGPTGPAARGAASRVGSDVDVLDWNDIDDSSPCSRAHMSDVAMVAGSRRPFDAYDANDPKLIDVHDRTTELPAEVLAHMVNAYKSGKHLTVNLSLQSPSSGAPISSDLSACTNSNCESIRRDQKLFYQGFLQMLDQTIQKQPEVADNAMLVIIAGNAGVNLDNELADLKSRYPGAFGRMVVVGGTDAAGNIANYFNHLNDNTSPNMVYARAENVYPVGCSGTSFGAPEVSSVLDAIWLQASNYTSAQILKAFHLALAKSGTNNVIPTDAKGKVTTNFINQVVQTLPTLPGDINPKSAVLPMIGGCPGGSASTTFRITAPTNVTWSISWTGLPSSIGNHDVSPASGTGNATITFTATVLPQRPDFTCNDTYLLTYGDQLGVTFSTGDFHWASVNYTYLAVY